MEKDKKLVRLDPTLAHLLKVEAAKRQIKMGDLLDNVVAIGFESLKASQAQ
jgi:hypothetical protein